MSRTEPKLRPSIAVSDMVLLGKVLESDIRRRISVGDRSLETLQVAKLKEYIDSFKPAQIVTHDILARYESGDYGINGGVIPSVQDSEVVTNAAPKTVVSDESLTDE